MVGDAYEYVGPPGIHDATIGNIEENEDRISVSLQTFDGDRIVLRFDGVREVRQNRPIGMMLYSLSKRVGESAPYLYEFVNWNEEDDAFLEIVADEFHFESVR